MDEREISALACEYPSLKKMILIIYPVLVALFFLIRQVDFQAERTCYGSSVTLESTYRKAVRSLHVQQGHGTPFGEQRTCQWAMDHRPDNSELVRRDISKLLGFLVQKRNGKSYCSEIRTLIGQIL